MSIFIFLPVVFVLHAYQDICKFCIRSYLFHISHQGVIHLGQTVRPLYIFFIFIVISRYAIDVYKRQHVVKYKCILPLDPGFMEEVSRLGIRPECFGIAWASDFWIENADGTTGIREVVSVAQLVKKSAIQKLELSRRYWKQLDVDDWKIVVIDRGGG